MTEDQLEQQCLEWFAEDGWEIAHGPDIAHDGPYPERVDYKQILLFADLEAALRRINPHLPESAIEQVVAVVRKPDSLTVLLTTVSFIACLLTAYRLNTKSRIKSFMTARF